MEDPSFEMRALEAFRAALPASRFHPEEPEISITSIEPAGTPGRYAVTVDTSWDPGTPVVCIVDALPPPDEPDEDDPIAWAGRMVISVREDVEAP